MEKAPASRAHEGGSHANAAHSVAAAINPQLSQTPVHGVPVSTWPTARNSPCPGKNLKAYVDNILAMEKITRVQTNLTLLQKHQAANLAAGRKPLEVEMAALRVGDFVLITFPGELTVEIGLNVKKASPHKTTFVAGYTNGYIYYTPTAKQLENVGGAQEDSDCRLAPAWEKLFYDKVIEMLKKL